MSIRLRRSHLKARVIRELLQTQNFLNTLSINNPGRIALDMSVPALAGLWRVLSVRAAFDVGQPVGSCPEDFLLLLAMRAPVGSIHLCTALCKMNCQSARHRIFGSRRFSKNSGVVKMKKNDCGTCNGNCLAQPPRPRKTLENTRPLIGYEHENRRHERK